jgi:two-component system OmpR family response regulator
MHLLVVEDEPKMARILRRGLERDGAAVEVARSGEAALELAALSRFDAIVLDVMLPGIDGFETCRQLRERDVWAPVLFLTARDEIEDRIRGLDGGADDYMTKPFAVAELQARLRALIRRGGRERATILCVGSLRMNPATHEAWRSESEIDLSQKEFALLEMFMRHPGQVLTRFQLLENTWRYDYEHNSNVIDVYVRYLREKIDRPFGLHSLQTVRGAGYRLRKDGGG